MNNSLLIEKQYTITVSSTEEVNRALSHIEFDFGYGPGQCNIDINNGATVEATSDCGTLQATTDPITLTINSDGDIISPQLPYSTSWAESCCPSS